MARIRDASWRLLAETVGTQTAEAELTGEGPDERALRELAALLACCDVWLRRLARGKKSMATQLLKPAASRPAPAEGEAAVAASQGEVATA